MLQMLLNNVTLLSKMPDLLRIEKMYFLTLMILKIPSISIDYSVIEKAKNVYCAL